MTNSNTPAAETFYAIRSVTLGVDGDGEEFTMMVSNSSTTYGAFVKRYITEGNFVSVEYAAEHENSFVLDNAARTITTTTYL